MLIGKALLDQLSLSVDEVTHIALDRIRAHLRDFDTLYEQALLETRIVLRLIGIDEDESSLQKLSATFRRSDLTAEVPNLRENAVRIVGKMARASNHLNAKLRQAKGLLIQARKLRSKNDIIQRNDSNYYNSGEYINRNQEIEQNLVVADTIIAEMTANTFEYDEKLVAFTMKAFPDAFNADE